MTNIQITPVAIEQIKKQLQDYTPNAHLRLGVKGSGCSGFTCVVQYEDSEPKEKDILLEIEGIKVVIDPKSILHFEGATLDWTSSLMKKGFSFTIPNTKSCGCGKSFSKDE